MSSSIALSLSGESNRVYDIQASSNFVNWFSIGYFTNTPGQPPYLDQITPPPSTRFYKATAVP